jgi:hypothetical protein
MPMWFSGNILATIPEFLGFILSWDQCWWKSIEQFFFKTEVKPVVACNTFMECKCASGSWIREVREKSNINFWWQPNSLICFWCHCIDLWWARRENNNNNNNKKPSVALSPQANYNDWATATCRRNLVSTFVDREVSRGQRSGSPTVVNLSFLDLSRYFSFK